MSQIPAILDEAYAKLAQVPALVGKIVVAYDEDDLITQLKGIRTYPAVGVVYEGSRSTPESKPTSNIGLSAEMVVAIIIVQQNDHLVGGLEKKVKAIDLLDLVRKQFMGQRSTVTTHKWHFLVEAAADLGKTGMVCWVQRWSLPIQFSPSN